jgi:DNA polymerase-3 subunit delta
MMSPRRVIIVHEADRLLAPKRAKDEDDTASIEPKKGKRAATSPADELEAYIEQPEPMTTLVFVSGPLDANRRVVKLLRMHADVVDCGTLANPREAAMWITRRLEMDELTIEPKALALLLDTTGLSLGRIRAEIEKMVLYAAGEATITAAHVRDLVIPQNEPGEVFALMDAIKNANAVTALREVSALIDSGIQPPMILGQLRAATIRLRPDARVKSGLEAVFRTDLAIKSSAGTPQYLLECLVVELCAR